MKYDLKRIPRKKSISIHIRDAQVIVRAPMRITEKIIDAFVSEKSSWILKKIAEQKTIQSEKTKRFISGEQFYFLGELYTLKTAGDLKEIDLQDQFILAPEENIKAQLQAWYLRQAEAILFERFRVLQDVMHVQVKSLKLRSYKTRWGVCHADGRITLNWRLVMAPVAVIDYVIIHELSHLKYMDHSKQFWIHVEKFMPDYKVYRKWLKTHGHRFDIFT